MRPSPQQQGFDSQALSIRLGLIGPRVSAEAAHPLLQALLPDDPRTIYDFHKGELRHGQSPCVYGTPRCEGCFLPDLCAYYRATHTDSGTHDTEPSPQPGQARLCP